MRLFALTSMAVCLCSVSPAARVADRPLERAVKRIEKNDADGLRRLLAQDPSLVRGTGAGLLPHWHWTLLHLATSRKASLDVVSALVDAGSDVNAQDNEGNTPLHFAVKRIKHETFPKADYDGIIRLLLEKKADVHIVNVSGASPLHTSVAFRADPSAVEMLIQAGADVNLKTFKSAGAWTPLHGAAAGNSPDIATVLLKYGAKLNLIDGRELTPTQVAERGGIGFWKTATVLHAYMLARAVNRGWAPFIYVPPAAGLSASIGGVVQGRLLWKGQPIAGATVYVEDDPAFGSARYGSTTTDNQGRFSITGVPPGQKRVGVNGNQRVSWISGGEPFVTAAEQSKMVVHRFNQDFHVCHVFDLGSPAQNESVGSRPVLRWDAHPDAKGYIVHLFDRTSWTALGWRLGDGATSVQVDSDLPPGSYQWRVDAVAPGGDVIACSAAPRGFIVHP